MSQILDAFEELLDAQEEACGQRITATIGGVSDKDCIPTQGNSDLIAVDGGSAIGGGYTLQMRKSDFPANAPAKGDSASVSCYADAALMLTSSPDESHGILTLRIGDLAAQN